MKQGWIDDKRLADIPHEKLEQLKNLADATDREDRTRQMQTLTALIRQPGSLQFHFTPQELDTLFWVLKEYASPAELALLSQVMRKFQKKPN